RQTPSAPSTGGCSLCASAEGRCCGIRMLTVSRSPRKCGSNVGEAVEGIDRSSPVVVIHKSVPICCDVLSSAYLARYSEYQKERRVRRGSPGASSAGREFVAHT